MSFELIVLNGFDIPLTLVVLSTGTPSITISGSLLADMDEPHVCVCLQKNRVLLQPR